MCVKNEKGANNRWDKNCFKIVDSHFNEVDIGALYLLSLESKIKHLEIW